MRDDSSRTKCRRGWRMPCLVIEHLFRSWLPLFASITRFVSFSSSLQFFTWLQSSATAPTGDTRIQARATLLGALLAICRIHNRHAAMKR